MSDLTKKDSKKLKCQLDSILDKTQCELDCQLDYFGGNPYQYKKWREYQKYDDIIRDKHNQVC